MKKNVAAVILAAGKSSRMGSSKFMLKYEEHITFLEQIINEFSTFGCCEIVIVINSKDANLYKNYFNNIATSSKIIINEFPEKERFYSVKLGLNALIDAKQVFIHNVDNPYANHQVLQLLVEHISGFDYAVPVFKGRGGHPVLLSEKVANDIKAEKKDGLNLKTYLKTYQKTTVEVFEKNVLLNVNSIADYNNYF